MKTEELQQLVLNSLGGCSWEYDLPADDLAFSDEFFELIGYAPNEMEIDRDWVAGNIHPDDLSQWQQCYAGSIKGHSRYFDCELRFRQKNGQYVWLQTRGVVSERDAQGRALRILGMVFDISERKAGKENELLYQMFLDNIPDAISLKDLEGRFLYVNRQFQAWLGKSADQIYGKTTQDVFPPNTENIEIVQQHERRVMEQGETISMERRFLWTADNILRHADITKFPVFGDDGGILAIGSSSSDATERHRVQEALRASERRYRRLFESAPVVLAETDWSRGRALVEDLSRQGVDDIRLHLIDRPELLLHRGDIMELLTVNQEALRVHKSESKASLRDFLEQALNPLERLALIDDLAAFAAGKWRSTVHTWARRQDGEEFPIIRDSELQGHDPDDWTLVLITIRDDSATEAVRLSEQRYRNLFESAPAVLCETDWSEGKKIVDALRRQGVEDIRQHLIEHPELLRRQDQAMRVLRLNREAVRAYRAESEQELIDYAASELNESQRLTLIEELTNLASGQRRSTIRSSNWRIDGEEFPVIRVAEVYSSDPEDWSQVLLTVRDISAEEAVRMSEMRYRRLFESAPAALFESDWSNGKALVDDLRAQGIEDVAAYLNRHPELVERRDRIMCLTNLNREALKVYQASTREQLIEYIEGPMNADQRAAMIEVLGKFAAGSRRASVRCGSLRANGEAFTMVRDSGLISSDRDDWSRVLSSIHDLTAEVETADRLRSYQEELRSLAGKISAAEEGERRRISSELHDGTIQNLVLARIHLANLRATLESGQSEQLADSINDLLEASLRETRSLIFEISPPVLYELGLESAVEWLAEHYQQRTGLVVRITGDERSTRLAEEMNIVVFQTARELLVNIAKHAQAQQVSIDWSHNAASVVLTVQDDGVGFDAETSQAKRATEGGFGLFAAKERLRLLGAEIDIESSKQGTRVTITAPVDPGQGNQLTAEVI